MNAMIDIETMGKGPRSAIAAIGAVEFNPAGGQLGRSFYTLVDLTSSVTAGMVIDADTVLWWLRQAEDARREIATEGGTPLPNALQALSTFLIGESIAGEIDELIVWANGTSFDFPILAEAYRLCGLQQPWHYFNERDWRTVRKIAPRVEIERAGTYHNALDDARHQARQLQAVTQAGLANDAYAAQAKRMAMELECLLLSCKDTAAVSAWWDSAHEALEAFQNIGREAACN